VTVARDRTTAGGPPPRRSEEKWKTAGQILAVVSGLLTVAASLLTLLTVNANHEKNLAQSTAADRGSQLTSAQQEISSLKQQTSQPSTTAETATTPASPGATVRHAGNVSIAPGFSVDLDAPGSDPQWGTMSSNDGKGDLDFDGRSFGYSLFSTTVKLPDSSAGSYDACRDETGYEHGRYPVDDLAPGQRYCVKTLDGRFAALRLISASTTKVSFDVTTYEK
jgi:hypothetical protein